MVSEISETQNRIEEQGRSISRAVEELLGNQQQDFGTMRSNQDEIVETTRAVHSASTQILEKFENIEKFFLTEYIPPRKNHLQVESIETTSSDISVPQSEKSEATTEVAEVTRKTTTTARYQRIAVQARRRRPFQCSDRCPCSCHIKPAAYTLDGLRSLLGQLFLGYNGLPVAKNPCSHSKCARKMAPTSSVTYFFPSWWVAQRMLSLVARMMAFGSPEVTLKFPRIVPATARIFRHAYLDETDALRALFATGLGSTSDVDAKTGTTPLHVTHHFLTVLSG